MRSIITLIVWLTFAGSVLATQDNTHTATPSGQAVPRFVSLKVDVANGRSGPSSQHPIAWRYLRAGLPMEVIAETPDWRRVRDPEGEITWMHRSILSGRRSVYTLEDTPLHARDSDSSPIEAVAEAGVVLSLERCRTGWCRVEGQGFRGWVRPHTLWGVYPQELDTGNDEESDGNPALSTSVAHDTALP
ncbi:SH3 domain-containing protein [Maricaulis sp.]|uniref:SH3 domain-containing protein n=1 Tax=Maricaulis sp. TaxID=1486257 RepID=UPI003A8FBA34